MNIIYCTNVNIKNEISFGILKKINGQADALRKLNNKVDICYIYNNKYIVQSIENKKIAVYEKPHINSFLNTLRGKHTLGHLTKIINRGSYDLVYIRFVSLDVGTLLFLKALKSSAKITLLEFPTYPYMMEKFVRFKLSKQKSLISHLSFYKQYIVDLAVRLVLRKYVSFIVLTIPKKILWGIPVISIDNGIQTNKVSMQKRIPKKNQIIIFTATNIETWQGLDRLISGLYEFRKQNYGGLDIRIKIAGEGPEKRNLASLIKKLNLNKYVVLYGQKTGKELDELYNMADIAIGSLGRHRQKTNLVSTLKIKEFCAKGIPFIYSNDEPSLTGEEDFALKIPADDSPVNFKKIIQFYSKINKIPDLPIAMREIAEQNYDWIHQMEIIHNRIQNIKKIIDPT